MEAIAESIIARVQSLSQTTKGLVAGYLILKAVIDQEHVAIQENNLNKIEAITQEKVDVHQEIASKVGKFNQDVEALTRVLRSNNLAEHDQISVKDLFSNLPQLIKNIPVDILTQKVLIFEANKLNEAFVELQDIHIKSSPKLEMNRYLLTKLLHQHRETFRFWQNLAMESEATYGSKGSTNQKKISSTLTVRT